MITHTITSSELRFFPAGAVDGDPYCASCVLSWESSNTVWIRLFNGTPSRDHIRSLLAWLLDNKVEWVKAKRGEGHSIPTAVAQPDGSLLLDVTALAKRLLRNQSRP